jgi:hypothetical protein
MPKPTRLAAAALTAALVLAAAADPAENLQRLRAMPLAQRQRLAEALRAFDALPPAERERLRDLDARLAALPAAERDRLLQVLHGYHAWLAGLPEPERLRLGRIPPDERIAEVARLREARRKQGLAAGRKGQPRHTYRDLLEVSSLGGEPLLVSAIELDVWFALPEPARAEVRKLPNPARQHERFTQLVRQSGGYQAHARAVFDRAGIAEAGPLRLEVAALLERRPGADLPARLKAAQNRPRLDAAIKKGMWDFLQARDAPAVEPRRLRRFEDEMPPWARDSFDLLPPDAARQRLAILYRLVFPEGQEIPEPAPKTKTRPPRNPAAPPRSGPGSVPAPF